MKGNRFIQPMLIAGVASGVLSSILIFVPEIGILVAPGISFGIGLCVLFSGFFKQKISVLNTLGIIAISAAAYYVAIRVALIFPLQGQADSSPGLVSFFLAGIAGALIVLIGIKFLLISLKYKQLFLLTLWGGLLGLLGWIFFRPSFAGPQGSLASFFLLYLTWQTGMMLGIAFCAGWNEKDGSNQVVAFNNSLIIKILVGLGIILAVYFFFLAPVLQQRKDTVCEKQATAADNACISKCEINNGMEDCIEQCDPTYGTIYTQCGGQ